jgi:hypothetical protein
MRAGCQHTARCAAPTLMADQLTLATLLKSHQFSFVKVQTEAMPTPCTARGVCMHVRVKTEMRSEGVRTCVRARVATSRREGKTYEGGRMCMGEGGGQPLRRGATHRQHRPDGHHSRVQKQRDRGGLRRGNAG